MSDKTYQQFVKRWEQVTDMPVQNLGPVTHIYKRFTKRLKVMPWPLMIIVSVLAIVGIGTMLGKGIITLTSILQRGF